MRQSSRQDSIPADEAESFDVGSVSLSTVEAVNRAEIDIQIATAKRFPRSMAHFRKRVYELATLDEETAASCFYSVPRGGRQIEGPSARMAEIVACCYGNLRVASRIVDDERRGTVTVEAVAIDLEANYAVKAEVVQRVVGKQDDDMRNLAVMSAQSKARRNAVFGVVPGSEIKAIMSKVREVAVGKAETIGSTRATVLDLLAKMGATKNRVLARVGVGDVAEIGLEHILVLRGLGVEIREGRLTVDEAFPLGVANPAASADGKSKLDGLKERLAKRDDAPKPPAEKEKAPPPHAEVPVTAAGDLPLSPPAEEPKQTTPPVDQAPEEKLGELWSRHDTAVRFAAERIAGPDEKPRQALYRFMAEKVKGAKDIGERMLSVRDGCTGEECATLTALYMRACDALTKITAKPKAE